MSVGKYSAHNFGFMLGERALSLFLVSRSNYSLLIFKLALVFEWDVQSFFTWFGLCECVSCIIFRGNKSNVGYFDLFIRLAYSFEVI